MTGTIAHLLAATLAFVVGHFVVSAPPVRERLIAAAGEKAFAGIYTAIALVLFVWMGFAYGAAPHVALWTPPAWTRLVPVLVLPFALFLQVCAVSQFNPTAGGQGFAEAARDPAPGILKVTRHPLMWAIGLFSLAHIPPNGDLASLILFGGLAALALYGTVRLDEKYRRRDPTGSARFLAATSNLPFLAMLQGRARFSFTEIGAKRAAVAALLYVALWLVHPWIAGVAVW